MFFADVPRVAVTFNGGLVKMTYGANFKLQNILDVENHNCTHDNQNTQIDGQEGSWIIHLHLYGILTLRVKPVSNGQQLRSSSRCGIFDESHRAKMKNSVCW